MVWLNFGIISCLSIYVLVCALLILLVLMQRTRNDGIGSAIASGMTQKYIGAQTSNFLQKATVWLTIMFFADAIFLDRLYTMRAMADKSKDSISHQLLAQPEQPKPSTELLPLPGGAAPAGTVPAGATAPGGVNNVPVPVPAPAVPPVPAPVPATAPSPAAATPTTAPAASGKPVNAASPTKTK